MKSSILPLSTIGALFLSALSVGAQQFDFQIANTSLEQLVVVQQQANQADVAGVIPTDPPLSTSVILQGNVGNNAQNSIIRSDGGVAAVLQTGDSNQSTATILDSPQSQIAGIQLGNDNSLSLAIVGGDGNVLAAAQIGTNNNLGVALVNSTGTTVTYGQVGQGVRGSVTFLNAPAGTNITLGGGI